MNSNANRSAAISNKANDNAEELGMLVNLMIEPEDLVWKMDQQKNMLIAVLRFQPSEASKLESRLASASPGAPRELTTETWFPAELIAQSESAGSSTIEGTAFPATDYYQPPYTEGTITRVNSTDFFVLELHSK